MSGFSFGQPSSSAKSPGSLFGTSGAGSSGSTGGSTFGGNAGATTGFSFGQTGNSGNSSGGTENKTGGLFGGGSTGSNLIGKPAGDKSSDAKPLFGSLSNPEQTPGTPSQPGSSNPFGSTTPAAPSGGLFGSKSSTTPAGQPPATSLFGASTDTTANQSQPASKPAFSFGNTAATTATSTSATTPLAGSSTAAPSSGLFGQQSAGGGGGLFGQKTGTDSSQPTGGLFGAKTAAPASTQTANASNLFATSKPAESSTTTGGLFGAKPSQPALGGFSFGAAKKDEKPAEQITQKPFSFPTTNHASSQPSSQPAATSASTASIFTHTGTSGASSGGMFAKPAVPASQASEPPKQAGFSFTPASTSTTAAGGTGSTPFAGFNLGGSSSQAATSAATSALTTTTSSASTSAPTAGPFSGFGTPTAAPSSSTAPATTATTAPAATTSSISTGLAAPSGLGTSINLSASTAGPLAPSQSRLRNKTMDEILTRWASDLTRYTKEFKTHAETIAQWDQIIVDNSTKIDQLYSKTRNCERQTMSVEMQLAAVENQQNELEAWLNKYENDVDEMLAKDGPISQELGGPDQERERTYKLAERLGERLDDMDRDLQSMIEEVNAANSSLGQSGKADEPITQIVKILNSHLSQLQAIDQGTSALQAKVAAAQKAAQGMNYMSGGMNGNNGATVDGFYRSYMGKR